MNTFTPLVLTAGEPAGIGPDLCVMLAQMVFDGPLVILADRRVLAARAVLLGLPFDVPEYVAGSGARLSVLHLPTSAEVTPGRLDVANSTYVLATLQRAITGCLSGEFAGMVTGPVHKGVINDAGIAFTGHTEFLAEGTCTAQVVMLLAGGGMRVALATTHLPLRAVADAITPDSLQTTLRILHAALQRDYASVSHFYVSKLDLGELHETPLVSSRRVHIGARSMQHRAAVSRYVHGGGGDRRGRIAHRAAFDPGPSN